MTDLLILMSNILDASSSIGDILNDYKKNGFEIAVLEHQGYFDAEVMLSRCIRTMAIAPVSHFAVCANGVGCYGYLLSESAAGGFPTLRKLQSTQLTESVPPDSGYWEEVDVQGFYKPSAGLTEVLMQTITPTRILAVCDSEFDQKTINNISFNNRSQIYIQASSDWLKGNMMQPWQSSGFTQANPPLSVRSPSSMRRFEYIDPAQNSFKYWQIAMHPDGLGFQTRYGRMGTTGAVKDKAFLTTTAAQTAYQDLIRQKLRKGYIET
ncbi:WGR domain-containing protein [Halomicronema sp. CCY15110]|uniref:WGR domain-containing protein n=1 Tax=Halomicronema sp. CCY15110 TaxID=2767773 RepID=UPI0019515579|nr:WGR domain-containing protein [Halomicronema sp. CCY15110]